MSPSTEMREEISGSEGEASPPTRVRGKTEVTHRKMSPRNQRERGLKESNRGRQTGSCKQLQGKCSFEKLVEGQSDFINQCRQLSERKEGKCRVRTWGDL